MNKSSDDESDRLDQVPHPRHAVRLVGQERHELALLDAHRSGHMPHAVILGGPAGIGKATLAWRLAKFLLANPRPDMPTVRDAVDLSVPAVDKNAAQVVALSHPDLVLLRREINDKTKRFFTEIRADDVRRAIGLFHRAAGAGGYRICIIDSTDDLNRSSANALLKIIEEPPPKSLFLLVSHQPALVMPTIRSRARLVRLDALSQEDIGRIIGHLESPWFDNDGDSVASAARQAHGSLHDALRLLGHRGVDVSDSVRRILDGLPSVDWRQAHKVAEAVNARDGDGIYKIALTAIFDWLAAQVRDRATVAPRHLAPYAEVWEKLAQSARETDALNLDKRPLILSMFSDLATAVRAASA